MLAKTLLLTSLILCLTCAMCLAYIRLPVWLTNQIQFDQKDQRSVFLASTRSSVATLLGSMLTALTALTAIGTAYVTYRNYLATQDKQLADTLAKATELLGSKESSTRLGGVFVLRRIALTSRQDSKAAMLVLAAHLRDVCSSNDQLDEQRDEPNRRALSDIQAILTVLGDDRIRRNEQDFTIDLSNVYLSRISLNRLNFSDFRFVGTHFYNIDFSQSDFSNTDLASSAFYKCSFDRTKLHHADLTGATFRECSALTQAQIAEAIGNRSTLIPGNLLYPPNWPNP